MSTASKFSITMKFLIAILLTTTLFACQKDVDELPEASQTGTNTFGARINGNFWMPQGFGVVPTTPILEANFAGSNSIRINARNFGSSPTETEMEIILFNITGPGTYLLNQTTAKYPNHSASYGYYVERRFTPKYEWITSATHTGRVDVTRYDKTAKIISGTFEFSAKEMSDATSPLSVTEGRFDLPIQ